VAQPADAYHWQQKDPFHTFLGSDFATGREVKPQLSLARLNFQKGESMKPFNKYKVSLEIKNDFVIYAFSEEEASQRVLDLGIHDTLNCADYQVSEVQKIKEL